MKNGNLTWGQFGRSKFELRNRRGIKQGKTCLHSTENKKEKISGKKGLVNSIRPKALRSKALRNDERTAGD